MQSSFPQNGGQYCRYKAVSAKTQIVYRKMPDSYTAKHRIYRISPARRTRRMMPKLMRLIEQFWFSLNEGAGRKQKSR